MAAKKTNILILWGDDIGYWNISAYNPGRWATGLPISTASTRKEPCSPTGPPAELHGRPRVFHHRPSGFRTGMLKVGLPGAKEGLQARDVTIAELLKDQGYMTAQFGKNHLGDADETLPTAHGFDEFFGSLYVGKKRMETIDDEVTLATLNLSREGEEGGKSRCLTRVSGGI